MRIQPLRKSDRGRVLALPQPISQERPERAHDFRVATRQDGKERGKEEETNAFGGQRPPAPRSANGNCRKYSWLAVLLPCHHLNQISQLLRGEAVAFQVGN